MTIIPPSPVVITFRGWKLKQPSVPGAPHGRPPHVAPNAQAASSITGRPNWAATAVIRSMSAGQPNVSTGITARLRGVIFRRRSSTSIVKVTGSTSTRTGTARW